ncbi:MAG: methyltransferase domain-containing protein [Candidatus Nanoarchaeia archaeon]
MVTSEQRLLLDLTYAEYEGIGTWYEYLVKLRVFKKLKNIKTVLVAGLPEEYGVSSDMIVFAKDSKLTIVDNRKEKLNEFVSIAKKFNLHKNIKTVLVKDIEKLPFKDNSFDLVTSTEAIQRAKDYKKYIKELERTSKKDVIVFVPNSYYYSHYIITKIKTIKLRDVLNSTSFRVIKKAYLDRPPWPAGVSVSSKIEFSKGSKAKLRQDLQKKGQKDSPFISLVKKIFLAITPALAMTEIFYTSPLREFLSHMFFVHISKQ